MTWANGGCHMVPWDVVLTLASSLTQVQTVLVLCPAGDTYDGEWKGDNRSGKGVQNWACGMCHLGLVGPGWLAPVVYTTRLFWTGRWPSRFLVFPAGGVYNGEWKDDTKHGRGIYTWANGMSHAWDLLLASDSVYMYSALQETFMTASGSRVNGMAKAF